MNEYINIIIQGAVQGFTEFLPVSSSGHLSVLQHFISPGKENLPVTVVLHLGTLAAVFIAFWRIISDVAAEFFRTVRDIFTGKFSWKKMPPARRMLFMLIISTAVLIPFYFFKDFFTAPEGDGDIVFEGIAFVYTAVLLFLSDACAKRGKTAGDITVKDALGVGFFQAVALFPGVSRSGSTVTSGLFCGFSRETAVSYSFLLGIPAILGGSVISLKDAADTGAELDYPVLAVGMAVAAIVGIMSIWFVRLIVKKDKLRFFGFYTVILGICCIAGGIYEHASGNSLIDFFKW